MIPHPHERDLLILRSARLSKCNGNGEGNGEIATDRFIEEGAIMVDFGVIVERRRAKD